MSKSKGAVWTLNKVLPHIESDDATPRIDVSTVLNAIFPSYFHTVGDKLDDVSFPW